MYTQCPECQIAFRVTAKVLQQAGGNVRCGNCGHAFNALEYLSEDMPEQDAVDAPEDNAAEPAEDLAETSRRLLATLDELAGPEEVRIEDTGIEWRVLDEAAEADDVSILPDQPEAGEERRYDDNTPLPDEFDDDEEHTPPAAPQRREADQSAKPDEFEERQGDLALSEPEDWADILAEVHDPSAESLEVEEELAAIHNELSAIDEALTDEVPHLDDSDLGKLADAVPDDLEADLIEQIEAGAVEELSTLHEVDDAEAPEEEVDTGVFESILTDDEDDDDVEDEDESADVDDSAEAAGDLAFNRESTGVFDAQIDEAARAIADGEDVDEYDERADEDLLDEPSDETDDSGQYEVEEGEPDQDKAEDEFDDVAENDDIDDMEDEENDDEIVIDSGVEEQQVAAAEEFDFAATMVGMENPEDLFDESSGEVETIIMEGEFIRNEVDEERLAAEHTARSELDDPEKLYDTYAMNRGKVRGGRRNYDPPSMVIIGAIVGLSLILVGQLVHNSRQSLATSGFFNSTVAPVYRMLGSPITPDWDINGWQFEATNGSVDDEETTLTIVSRIANRSTQSLPYPLVHVSLTNRFEDVMGSAILEPGEYLAGDGDPSQPVEPGEDFTAVITVDDPSVDATGFKLYVCYRVAAGTVRCADHDFKN